MVGGSLSLGTLASSTAKTGRHDIAEILLKVALNTKDKKINKIIPAIFPIHWKVLKPSKVLRLWSTLSTTNCEKLSFFYPGISVA
jgi:hypothetical protein